MAFFQPRQTHTHTHTATHNRLQTDEETKETEMGYENNTHMALNNNIMLNNKGMNGNNNDSNNNDISKKFIVTLNEFLNLWKNKNVTHNYWIEKMGNEIMIEDISLIENTINERRKEESQNDNLFNENRELLLEMLLSIDKNIILQNYQTLIQICDICLQNIEQRIDIRVYFEILYVCLQKSKDIQRYLHVCLVLLVFFLHTHRVSMFLSLANGFWCLQYVFRQNKKIKIK